MERFIVLFIMIFGITSCGEEGKKVIGTLGEQALEKKINKNNFQEEVKNKAKTKTKAS